MTTFSRPKTPVLMEAALAYFAVLFVRRMLSPRRDIQAVTWTAGAGREVLALARGCSG